MDDKTLLGRIVADHAILAGTPVIRRTRLSADFILGLLAHEATDEEKMCEYSDLNTSEIRACLLLASQAIQKSTFMLFSPQTG